MLRGRGFGIKSGSACEKLRGISCGRRTACNMAYPAGMLRPNQSASRIEVVRLGEVNYPSEGAIVKRPRRRRPHLRPTGCGNTACDDARLRSQFERVTRSFQRTFRVLENSSESKDNVRDSTETQLHVAASDGKLQEGGAATDSASSGGQAFRTARLRRN